MDLIVEYNELNKRIRTTEFYKVDLHIHTPGSKKDYKVGKEYYEKVTIDALIDIAKDKKLDKLENFVNCYNTKDELMALLIINEAYSVKHLNLIAITDHNNIDWYDKIREAAIKYFKMTHDRLTARFMMLPGVEITCFSGTHIIAIFDEKDYMESWNYVKYELNGKSNEQNKIFTSKSEMDVVFAINKVGGIVYVPHLDNNEGKIKDMLSPLSGQSKAQLLTSKYVNAIGFRNYDFSKTVKETLENKNELYYRSDPVAYLKDSDSHEVNEIGTNYMFIKMEKPSFNSLKFALNDPKTRLRENIEKKVDIPYIIGVITNGGYLTKDNGKPAYYPFSIDMNCIIGGRGTGKSTLIRCIESCFMGVTPDHTFRRFMSNFNEILIYFHMKSDIYCIKFHPEIIIDQYSNEETNLYGEKIKSKIINIENWIDVYKITKDKSCKLGKLKKFDILKEFNVDYFEQMQIIEISNNKAYLDDLLNNIIKKSSSGRKYLSLMKKSEKIFGDLSGYKTLQINDNLIDIIKNSIDDLDVVLKDIDEIKLGIVDKLNFSMEHKVKLIYSHKQLEIENILLNALSDRSDLHHVNNSKEKRLANCLSYLAKKYSDIFKLCKMIINNEIEIKNEVRKFYSQSSESFAEAEETISIVDYLGIIKEICVHTLKDYSKVKDEMSTNVLLNVKSYDKTDTKEEAFKEINILSFGQRTVAILTIIIEGMTSLNINIPLIIDQPEDQLDNRFIYENLIKIIRALKQKRQLIFVTHNANIPVSGDAENIICMASDNVNGWIADYGPLDNINIRKEIINIMEGGKESFNLRIKKYSNDDYVK